MKRIIILVIIMLHGLIHLLGFLKAFRFAEIEQLTLDISAPLGVIWLVAAFLFFSLFYLYLSNKQSVWLPAFVSVLTSQTLIFLTWQDAKFGTIPNLIIFLFAIFSYATWLFNRNTSKEVLLLQKTKPSLTETKIISEDMLASLPSAVQKWLKQTGVIGRNPIKTAYFKQMGYMKLKPEQKQWARADVEQFVTTEIPGFLWKVHMKMSPLITVVGRDSYVDGKAQMLIKLAAIFPVVKVADNEKVNQSTLQRYLLELPWYPTAALSPYISWEEVDEITAKATLSYKGEVGSATYYFDASGDFVKASAMRYKENDDKAEPIECIGQTLETGVINGIKIPTKLTVTWMLPTGPFTWYKIHILEAKYNQ